MNKKVIKRDGSIEMFSAEKITRVVTTAGLPQEKAQTLSIQVAGWASAHTDEAIPSLQIRDKVLELLAQVDSDVADFFRWYQKSKEVK